LTNGETVPGEISTEVFLSDGLKLTSPQLLLGQKRLPSSIGNALNRKQVDEAFTFDISRSSSLGSVDSITLRVEPDPDREMDAPRAAI
jgi:hypothetical protein